METYFKRWKALLIIGALILVVPAGPCAFTAFREERTLGKLLQEPSFASVMAATSALRVALRNGDTGAAKHDPAIEQALHSLVSSWTDFSAVADLRIGSDPVGIAASLAFSDHLNALQQAIRSAGTAMAVSLEMAGHVAELERLGFRVSAIADEDFRASAVAQENEVRRSEMACLILGATIIVASCLIIAGLLRFIGHVQRVARRDNLTGLQNRLTFSETLASRILDPGPGNDIGLLLLDLDAFKAINDTIGHSAGDELLKAVARRLRSLPQGGLTLARLGGDEFAIIVVARSAHRVATNIAGMVANLLKEPFLLDGRPVQVTMSIGIASSPAGWCNAEDLLRFADVALYEAKSAGRNTFRVYNAKMSQQLLSRRELEADLRQAVARHELDLHFQPIVSLTSAQIVSFEALARWNHPRLGPVPPAKFIPLAEETGLIKPLGTWILEEACRVARTWPSHIRICINLSACQFEGHDLTATLVAILARTGIVPDRIELEITESVLLGDSAHTLRVLTDLKALGVRVALDDFGTGYSSLAYLQHYPFDKIKIDRSFIREAASKPQSACIVESIAQLASRLGIATTAEGLESDQDVELVRRLGCDEGQGYFFDRPLTREQCLQKFCVVDGEFQPGPAAAA